MAVKAVIVEDSRLARLELKELLKNYAQIQVVGEAENVDKAYALIQETQPNLLFLDINMPKKNGFELLEMLDKVPTVIFTTAYDEYAIKAFEHNAFDYLLKPISEERFSKSIDKVLPFLNTQETENTLTENSQIFIKDGEDCWMVTIKDIVLFEIVGNYTRVYFKDKKPLIYKSLNQIEAKLPENLFFRANRQQIINLKAIKNITPWFSGKLKMALNNGIDVEVSRRQSTKFKNELEF